MDGTATGPTPGALLPPTTPAYWLKLSRRPHHLRSRGFAGVFLHVVGVAIIVGSFLSMLSFLQGRPRGVVVYFEAGLLITVAVSGGNRLRRQGSAVSKRPAWSVARSDGRPLTVYLRSFLDDGSDRHRLSGNRWFRFSEDEELEAAVRPLGPLVAIGQPGDRRSRVGPARLFVNDQMWKQAVIALTAAASVVLVRVGASPGLAWEIRWLTAHNPPERLVLLVPADPGRYARFRQQLADSFPSGLPDIVIRPPRRLLAPRIGAIVSFDASWNPTVTAVRRRQYTNRRVGLTGLALALRPVMARITPAPPAAPRSSELR